MNDGSGKIKKSLGVRQLELVQSLQIIRDCLNQISKGEMYQFIPLCGQLRALLHRGKSSDPLLLSVAKGINYEPIIYSLPSISVNIAEFPHQEDLVFLYTGLEISLFKELPGQQAIIVDEWLETGILEYKKVTYSAMTLIKFFADKSGGAHYDPAIPQDMAELLSIHFSDQPLIVSCVIKVAEIVYKIGVDVIKKVCDLAIYMLVGIPNQSIENIAYVFDAKHNNTPMRFSLSVDSLLRPTFKVTGVDGYIFSVPCKRLIDWSEPKIVLVFFEIMDNLHTKATIAVDGEIFSQAIISRVVFVSNDLIYYHRYYNRSVESENDGLTIGIGSIAMYSCVQSYAEIAQCLIAIANLDTELKGFCALLRKGKFGYAPPGTNDVSLKEIMVPWDFERLCKGELPER